MSKTFSEMLIERGVYPGRKKFSKVTPKGIYRLSPWAWKTAKLLEDSRDFSYEMVMNQYRIAKSREKIYQTKGTAMSTPPKPVNELREILRLARWGDYQDSTGKWRHGISNEEEIEAAINKLYISREAVLEARPAIKKGLPSYEGWSMSKIAGYNQALKDWSKALGLELRDKFKLGDE